MASTLPLPNRERPPGPIRAVRIIFIVLGTLVLLLALSEFIAGVGEADPSGRRATTTGQLLIVGLFIAYTARLVGRGRRGGLVMAVLVALFILCFTPGLSTLPGAASLFAYLPLILSIAVLVLLFGPSTSRDWFRPNRWASTG